ncbi:MAG: hypothetical protein J6386_10745 [Candidatus Synoicihabitans palmerolidicus]|nr:hypothetical protein [Candidatus Synoicihabitans palmerolidicus]
MAATAIFGGIIPWIYLRLMPATRSRYNATQGLGLTAFWAVKDLEVHALYATLAWLVGTQPTVGNVLLKSALAQFVYGPRWAVPGMWLGYQWIENKFNFAQLLRSE